MRIYPFNGIKGRFTWESEGSADPCAANFNMFRPHVPGDNSGVTICGYDFYWNRKTLAADLAQAGLSPSQAQKIRITFSERTGTDAIFQLNARENWWPEWSALGRAKLFEIAYDRLEQDVNRIHGKPGFLEKYGDMPDLPLWIWELLVDLRFRGDYTPASREFLIPPIMQGAWSGVTWRMENQDLWPDVPKDRFQRRADYAKQGWESMQPVANHGLAAARVIGLLDEARAGLKGFL